ncbi:hypothetical protein ACTA71_007916 [Dictyostelium dimigraforme]
MKFKYITGITLILSIVGCVISNLHTGNKYKYLQFDSYQTEDCTGDIYSVEYSITGQCSGNTIYNCDNDGESFTENIFKKDCSGVNYTQSFATRTCTSNQVATCIEEMGIQILVQLKIQHFHIVNNINYAVAINKYFK